MIPVSQIWEETLAFVQRELSLLLPASLATMGLGQSLMFIGSSLGKVPAYASISGLATMLGLILLLGGLMTVTYLALRPGSSVGEALGRGFGRLPAVGLLILMLTGVLIVLILPLAVALAGSGIDFSDPQKVKLPAMASFYLMGVGVFGMWLGLRVYAVFALLVDTAMSPLEAARRSFAITRGHVFVLLGVSLVFLLVGMVVDAATQMVVGSIFGAIGRALDAPMLPMITVALVGGMVSAAISMVTTSFTAFLYRYLNQQPG